MRKFLASFSILLYILSYIPLSYALRPEASKLSSAGSLEVKLLSQMMKQEGAPTGEESWAALNAPGLKDYTVASLQFEAGLNNIILRSLTDAFGLDSARFTSQVTMTGGLGALMHDLVIAWAKNGADIVAIHPLYNGRVKGLVEGLPELPRGKSFGDLMRQVLKKMDIECTVRLQGKDFAKSANNKSARYLIGKDIYVDFYTITIRHGDIKIPLYYQDAYYMDELGNRCYIYYEAYPDDDFRAVQMAVYNEASQLFLKELQARNQARDKILFVENEVIVSLPKRHFPHSKKHNINHSVASAAVYTPRACAYEMLGFDEDIRGLIVRDGRIHIVDYIGLEADRISGVSLYEHTRILQERIFRNYAHRVTGYSRAGMRSTNGVLLDHWQGEEFRALIMAYKEKLGLGILADDREFYKRLDQSKNSKLKEEFMERFEIIKALYMLDLLILLYHTQKQDMGGSTWLADILEGTGYDPGSIIETRRYFHFSILKALLEDESVWGHIGAEFSPLINNLMANPILSNLRRQVPYKCQHKYEEILKHFESGGEEAAKAFRESGAHLLIGGRIFYKDARTQFNKLKAMAKRLGLEDRFAFVENYNFLDAPFIFSGVAGPIMLTYELLEASGTGMMKSIINGGVSIGVFGGSNTELFTIYDTEEKRIVDVLEEDISYDQIEAGHRSGRYVIKNGYLVYFSNIREKEFLDGRSPSAESLLACITQLGRDYNQVEARREKIFESLKTTPKVDIERSQARAHMKIWQEIIREGNKLDRLVTSLRRKGAHEKVAELRQDEGFEWRYKPDMSADWTDKIDLGETNSLIGFLDSFRNLRALGLQGLYCIQHHCSHEKAQGDVLMYLQSLLEGEPSFALLKDKVDEFAERVQAISGANHEITRADITFEAMDFTDRVVRVLLKTEEVSSEAEPGAETIPAAERPVATQRIIQGIRAAA